MSNNPMRSPETAHREIDDEGGLVVVPSRSEVNVLNPLGSTIYGMLDGSHTLDEIVAAVVAEYEVPEEQARQDVQAFLDQLKEKGMLVKSGENSHE